MQGKIRASHAKGLTLVASGRDLGVSGSAVVRGKSWAPIQTIPHTYEIPVFLRGFTPIPRR